MNFSDSFRTSESLQIPRINLIFFLKKRREKCILVIVWINRVWFSMLIKMYLFVISGLPIFVFRSSYLCNNCGKTYKWKESLNLHKRMECGIEPRFCCKVCGRRFKHKHHLTKHHKSIHNYVDQWWSINWRSIKNIWRKNDILSFESNNLLLIV